MCCRVPGSELLGPDVGRPMPEKGPLRPTGRGWSPGSGLSIHTHFRHSQEKPSSELFGSHTESHVVDLAHCEGSQLLRPFSFLFHVAEMFFWLPSLLSSELGMLVWSSASRASEKRAGQGAVWAPEWTRPSWGGLFRWSGASGGYRYLQIGSGPLTCEE